MKLAPADEAAGIFCEFLEVAIHHLLSVRGIYPPGIHQFQVYDLLNMLAEVFERRRHFNVPVSWARHPELREYIHSATSSLLSWIRQGVVEKVAVVVLDENQAPIERFMFKLHLNGTYSKELPENDLKYSLRAFYLKLTASQHLFVDLPSDCSWEVVAYSKQLPGDGSSNSEVWIPSDSGTWEHPPVITPVKSMMSEPLQVQLYVEHPPH